METIIKVLEEIIKLLKNHCDHDLEELKYYYDDDWGFKGSIAWDEQGKEKTLYYCKKCGQVFVKDRTKQGKF